jgi:hypothetical protein
MLRRRGSASPTPTQQKEKAPLGRHTREGSAPLGKGWDWVVPSCAPMALNLCWKSADLRQRRARLFRNNDGEFGFRPDGFSGWRSRPGVKAALLWSYGMRSDAETSCLDTCLLLNFWLHMIVNKTKTWAWFCGGADDFFALISSDLKNHLIIFCS